jgi:hypothetical protein
MKLFGEADNAAVVIPTAHSKNNSSPRCEKTSASTVWARTILNRWLDPTVANVAPSCSNLMDLLKASCWKVNNLVVLSSNVDITTPSLSIS